MAKLLFDKQESVALSTLRSFKLDLSQSLKDANRREPGKRLHILVMNDGGSTRRLSVSLSFLWIIATLSILILFSLGVLSWMVSSLLVEHKNLQNELGFLKSYSETREYNKSLVSAPEDARLILERLDRAALNAEEDEDELVMPQPVEGPKETIGASKNPGNPSQAETLGGDPKAQNNLGEGGEGEGASGAGEKGENPGERSQGSEGELPGNNLAGAADQDAQAAAEAAAWASLHNRLSMPGDEKILDVDEFRFSQRGSYSFYLQQIKSPGTRLKGRALTVFAVEDKTGKVTLISDPSVDLSKPFQGYERGGRYNIVSSKVFRGNIRIPEGGKALSAEVLAWDEETKELVFIKKISLRGL